MPARTPCARYKSNLYVKYITRLFEDKNLEVTPEERASKIESCGNAHALLFAALDESPREMCSTATNAAAGASTRS